MSVKGSIEKSIKFSVYMYFTFPQEAIAAGSYLKEAPSVIVQGDVDAGFSRADHVIEGEMRLGGQEHFYLETQSCIAVPKEDGEMEVFSSTQSPANVQVNLVNCE